MKRGRYASYIYIYVVDDGKLFYIPEILTVFCKVFLHKNRYTFLRVNVLTVLNTITFVQKYHAYVSLVNDGCANSNLVPEYFAVSL